MLIISSLNVCNFIKSTLLEITLYCYLDLYALNFSESSKRVIISFKHEDSTVKKTCRFHFFEYCTLEYKFYKSHTQWVPEFGTHVEECCRHSCSSTSSSWILSNGKGVGNRDFGSTWYFLFLAAEIHSNSLLDTIIHHFLTKLAIIFL